MVVRFHMGGFEVGVMICVMRSYIWGVMMHMGNLDSVSREVVMHTWSYV